MINTNAVPSPAIPGTGNGTLYVFIHGLICLVQRPGDFLGLIPDLGDDHTYRVGDWLVELPMTRDAKMTLTGVTGGTAGLGSAITVVPKAAINSSVRLFASIELPRPVEEVKSFRRTEIPAAMLYGPGTATLASGNASIVIAALHVFKYTFNDLSEVLLEGGGWGPPTVFRDSRVATLHLFAEPEQLRPPRHQTDEFRTAAQLLSVDVSISSPVRMQKLEPNGYPDDLSKNEALSLIERRDLLFSVAAAYKDDSPFELSAHSEGGPGGVLCAPLCGDL
jgi:hypothetical protein